jgi:hypothetical protein
VSDPDTLTTWATAQQIVAMRHHIDDRNHSRKVDYQPAVLELPLPPSPPPTRKVELDDDGDRGVWIIDLL